MVRLSLFGLRNASSSFASRKPVRATRIGTIAALIGLTTLATAGPATAAFFGLFGSDDAPPAVSPTTLPYDIKFDTAGKAAGDKSDPVQALKDASNAYKLRSDAPTDGQVLSRRIDADFPALVDALWALGYYDAEVSISIAGVPVRLGQTEIEGAARAAEAYRNRAAVPVTIHADLGPLFHVRGLSIAASPEAATILTPKIVGLKTGDPARASDLRAADVRMVDALRDRSYPLAKADDPSATVDHATATVDVSYRVTAGPLAGIGQIAVDGTKDVPPEVVRSFIYLDYGEPYSPKKIADTRKSISTIPAIGGVRIREAQAVDQNSNLPLFVAVTERPKNAIGLSARYSTIDGPQIHPYYENRNLFGGAERIRIEGDTFLLPRTDGYPLKNFRELRWSDLGGRATLSFLKPALGGSRNDLLFDMMAERNRIGSNDFGGYTDRAFVTTLAIRHRFTQTFSAQAGVQFEASQTDDILGRVTGRLIGVPLSVTYDSTDNTLNPTRGTKITASATPYVSLNQNSSFGQVQGSATAYLSLDADSRYILAGRVTAGTLFGAPLTDIPDTHRFFAGGSDTVRGYAFRTLAPMAFGNIVGGKSLIAGNLEARIGITDTIQVVPFVDVGTAYAGSIPNLKTPVGVGAGLGLRYLTSIGPIRVDVATPLEKRKGDRALALYIGIGQDF